METPRPAVEEGSGSRFNAFDPELFPAGHRPWWKRVADHNPCLLLSTVFMLLGCCLANLALADASDMLQMLALLGVINLYEACIIPLGLALIRRSRGTARDGLWLVLFEMLFLVNASLINWKIGPWAWPLEVVLWALACVKAAIILRELKIGLGFRTFGFLALQLAIIYALPIVLEFAAKDRATLNRVMYGLLWLVGLVPVIYDVVARACRRHKPWDKVQNVVRRAYVIAPWCMLVLHTLFWREAHSYIIEWTDVAPALLGLAAMSRRLNLAPAWRSAIWFAPAMALFMTLCMQKEELRCVVNIGGVTKVLSAAHLMLVATILTYGYMGSLWYLLAAAEVVAVMSLTYFFMSWITQALRSGVRTAGGLVPATVYAWSVTTIVAAFLLLGIGGYLGLRRVGKHVPQDVTALPGK